MRTSKVVKDPWRREKTLGNIHKTKNLFNILFVHCMFFMYKMQKNDNLLDHTNKVKTFSDQLVCLEVFVKDKDIIITLLKILLALYEYLITALEMMPMKELTMDYVTSY